MAPWLNRAQVESCVCVHHSFREIYAFRLCVCFNESAEFDGPNRGVLFTVSLRPQPTIQDYEAKSTTKGNRAEIDRHLLPLTNPSVVAVVGRMPSSCPYLALLLAAS
jgi:hypothetical protein